MDIKIYQMPFYNGYMIVPVLLTSSILISKIKEKKISPLSIFPVIKIT